MIERWLRRAEGLAVRPVNKLEAVQLQLGRLQSELLANRQDATIGDAEFRVFSQFGEDGIIQFLVHRVELERKVFVELGVESYRESNTRFLLQNDNWAGLIVDSGSSHERFLRRRGLDWRYHIDARTAQITRDNVDALLSNSGVEGDIGLLSIDIDGNDLWTLQAIEIVSPRILVVEYNSTFGAEHEVTIPYQENFRRNAAHSSLLYWGASLAALDRVAREKGYALVGGNSAGNNAFWVREDVMGELEPMAVSTVWAPAQFRESRGPRGRLTYLGSRQERLKAIRGAPLYDLDQDREVMVADLYGV